MGIGYLSLFPLETPGVDHLRIYVSTITEAKGAEQERER